MISIAGSEAALKDPWRDNGLDTLEVPLARLEVNVDEVSIPDLETNVKLECTDFRKRRRWGTEDSGRDQDSLMAVKLDYSCHTEAGIYDRANRCDPDTGAELLT